MHQYIKSVSEKFSILPKLIEHSYDAGQKESSEVIPFLTTLAAIIYVLCLSLGSGSYKDLLPKTGFIIEAIMIIIVFLFSIMFCLGLASYIDKIVDFVPRSFYEKSRPTIFKTAHLNFVILTSFLLMFVICLDRFSAGYRVIPNIYMRESPEFFFILFFSLIFSFFFMAERYFRSVPALALIVFLVLVSCIYGVALGTYRDSQKNSINTDSQYCYWVKSALASEELSANDLRTCQKLENIKINFMAIKVRNSE